jgi:molybdopterin-binding protein
MRVSARNVLKGKIKHITEDVVDVEVIIELPGGQEVVAIITKTSVHRLDLAVGMDACAIIKATNVMLGVE